jgi:hypothetical protein
LTENSVLFSPGEEILSTFPGWFSISSPRHLQFNFGFYPNRVQWRSNIGKKKRKERDNWSTRLAHYNYIHVLDHDFDS